MLERSSLRVVPRALSLAAAFLLPPFLAVAAAGSSPAQDPQPGPSPPASPLPSPSPARDATRWDAPEQAKSVKNPLAPSDANLKKGASLFKRYCVPCHGPKGKGDGPVAHYWVQLPKDLADPARQDRLSDGEMFWKLSRGHRQGADVVMPAFAERIPSAEDRWKLVLHVRTLRSEAPAKP